MPEHRTPTPQTNVARRVPDLSALSPEDVAPPRCKPASVTAVWDAPGMSRSAAACEPAGRGRPGRPAARRLAFGALLAAVIAWLAYSTTVITGAETSDLQFSLLVIALSGAVVACLTGATRRSAVYGRVLAVALAAYATSTLFYTAFADAASRFPSVYDVGLFLFYPVAFVALVVLVRNHVAGLSFALWLDAAIGGSVVAAIGALLVTSQITWQTETQAYGQLLWFLAGLGFVGFLLATYALSGWRGGPALFLVAAGACVIALADGVYLSNISEGSGAPTVVPSLGWPGGLLLLAFSAFFTPSTTRVSSSTWVTLGIPTGAALILIPIVVTRDAYTLEVILGATGLALIVARLAVSLLDNARLLEITQQMSLTDALTGLGNRRLLLDRLEQAMSRSKRSGAAVAVIFLDLDDFKAINDTHGHDFGDRVLIAVAERLRASLRRADIVCRGTVEARRDGTRETVGRLGGDEFILVLEGLDAPEIAGSLAARILDDVRATLHIDGAVLELDASIGVTITDAAANRTPGDLLRDGDTAMYAAKRLGKGRYELFTDAMRTETVDRAELLHDLRQAVEKDWLDLVYQPQVDLSSGRMTGVEALVRWNHPSRGPMTPDAFIPLAESSGLIVKLDDWVLRAACEQLRRWDDAGLPALDMAVNVSAHRLVTRDLPSAVAAILDETGVPAHRLELEVTETTAVEHNSDAVEAINRVRRLGVHVAIDDFGMGHSALSRLHSFPVDRLKIDRYFIADLSAQSAVGSIAEAMITMAHHFKLEVVAEGVETQAHLDALTSLGCDSAQGYLFSRPVHATEIARMAREQGRLAPPARVCPSDQRDENAVADHDRLVRTLLAELQRLTGLESTYLTSIDWSRRRQRIIASRNTAVLDIKENLDIDWSDTVCRQSLERGLPYTTDVAADFPDSETATELGLQTYLSVATRDNEGQIIGTLCGASTERIELNLEALEVVDLFGKLISRSLSGERVTPERA